MSFSNYVKIFHFDILQMTFEKSDSTFQPSVLERIILTVAVLMMSPLL